MDRQKLIHQMEMGGRFKGGGSLGRPLGRVAEKGQHWDCRD